MPANSFPLKKMLVYFDSIMPAKAKELLYCRPLNQFRKNIRAMEAIKPYLTNIRTLSSGCIVASRGRTIKMMHTIKRDATMRKFRENSVDNFGSIRFTKNKDTNMGTGNINSML